MTTIYRYRNDVISRSSLDLLNDAGDMASTNLCEIDSWCYVSVADDAIPDPSVTLEPVTLTDELRAQIKSASPHCKLIKTRKDGKIAERYSLEDRLEIAAIAGGISNGFVEPSESYSAMMTAYRDHVVSANMWAAEQYAALGL